MRPSMRNEPSSYRTPISSVAINAHDERFAKSMISKPPRRPEGKRRKGLFTSRTSTFIHLGVRNKPSPKE